MNDAISRQAVIDDLKIYVKLADSNMQWHTRDEFLGAIDDIEELPSALQWISVSKRLPEKDGDYLVTFALLNIQVVEVCAYQRGEWDKGAYDAVLAWMPLPEPYIQSNSKN